MSTSVSPRTHPGPIGMAAAYLLFAGQVARTLTFPRLGRGPGDYAALFTLYIVLFSLVSRRSRIHSALLHSYFFVQSALTLVLLSWNPEIDSITVLFLLLIYQAAILFTGQARWLWIAGLALAVPISLVLFLGLLPGLSAGLVPMAVGIVIAAIVAVNEEIEGARLQSERLVRELEETHRQLQSQASQAEEMAALEERNRLARELHDSVSQTIFAITLNTRSAQMLLTRDPAQVQPQLQQLQALAQNALLQMRQLIAQMRP